VDHGVDGRKEEKDNGGGGSSYFSGTSSGFHMKGFSEMKLGFKDKMKTKGFSTTGWSLR
jgi:hypothetical protein